MLRAEPAFAEAPREVLGAQLSFNVVPERLRRGGGPALERRVEREVGRINAVSGSMAGNLNHTAFTDVASLTTLQKFIEWKNIDRFESLSGFARAVRAGALSGGPD